MDKSTLEELDELIDKKNKSHHFFIASENVLNGILKHLDVTDERKSEIIKEWRDNNGVIKL